MIFFSFIRFNMNVTALKVEVNEDFCILTSQGIWYAKNAIKVLVFEKEKKNIHSHLCQYISLPTSRFFWPVVHFISNYPTSARRRMDLLINRPTLSAFNFPKICWHLKQTYFIRIPNIHLRKCWQRKCYFIIKREKVTAARNNEPGNK